MIATRGLVRAHLPSPFLPRAPLAQTPLAPAAPAHSDVRRGHCCAGCAGGSGGLCGAAAEDDAAAGGEAAPPTPAAFDPRQLAALRATRFLTVAAAIKALDEAAAAGGAAV